jgi:hypothetical protein
MEDMVEATRTNTSHALSIETDVIPAQPSPSIGKPIQPEISKSTIEVTASPDEVIYASISTIEAQEETILTQNQPEQAIRIDEDDIRIPIKIILETKTEQEPEPVLEASVSKPKTRKPRAKKTTKPTKIEKVEEAPEVKPKRTRKKAVKSLV